jgi:hypothetical protein
MKVAYYPGCSLETTGIEFNLSTEYCAKKVDLDLWEIPSWNCCGASSAHTVDHLLALALPARNLAIAEKEGLDVAVPCAACYTHFKNVETAVRQDEEVQQEVAQVIDMDYHATNNTRSILEVFVDKVGLNAIGAEITKPLTGNLSLNLNSGVLVIIAKIEIDSGQQKGMAHGNQFKGSFCTHNSCHLGNSQYIPLFYTPCFDQFQCLRIHINLASGTSHSLCDILGAHIDHPSPALVIKMRKIIHWFIPLSGTFPALLQKHRLPDDDLPVLSLRLSEIAAGVLYPLHRLSGHSPG